MHARNAPFRIMAVCTGNICRSAMAEVVLSDHLAREGLGGAVVVDSTGISDEEAGNPIDRRARRVLEAHSYRVDNRHRARKLYAADLATCDLVLAMTAQHARAVRRIADGSRAVAPVVRMYRSFDPSAPDVRGGAPEHALDIADPWYGGPADFEECLAQLEAGVGGICDYVRERLAARDEDGDGRAAAAFTGRSP